MDQKEYRLAAVVHTDIVGFSRMMERDQMATVALIKQHNASVAALAAEHGGKVIKTVGDTALVDFSSTVNAVRFATAIQQSVAGFRGSHPGSEFSLRAGVHLGDIYFFEDDAVGEGINIAVQLQELARPGTICISQEVYNLVANKVEKQIVPIGEVTFKNISRAIQAYEIVVDVEAAAAPASRPQTRQAVEPAPEELKPRILQEIKRLGRRITVDEARAILHVKSAAGEMELQSLAQKGIIATRGSASVRSQDAPQGPARDGTGAGSVRPGSSEAQGGGWDRWARDIAREIESHVKDQTESRGGPADHRARRRATINAMRDARRDVRHQARHGSWSDWDEGIQEEGSDTLVEDYRNHAVAGAERARAGFRGHAGAYIAVNGILAVIWFTTGAGFPWFLIPAGAWAIGLITHLANVRTRSREADEIQSIENLNPEHLRIIRKLNRVRSSWVSHLVSNLTVSGFLVMLNMITSPGFPWFVFPVGAMAIGLFSHFPVYAGKLRDLRRKLAAAGAQIGKRFRDRSPVPAPGTQGTGDPSPAAQAEAVRIAITSQLSTFGKGESPLGEDFLPLLENYVNQIKELDEKDRELEQIINSIPMGELEKDLVRLTERKKEASDQRVLEEYGRSIEQIHRQQHSFRELRNEKEMLHLRTNSALNSLKQMQIDLARMKSISSGSDAGSLSLLKEKSGELSQYLEDLREGYRQLE
ncbi:MAG TPA: 2TM domain-containing protein [Spirochaetia bacterium]|nr:2TM domain-containing protein [Spirochaetia bacterium]